MGSVRQTDFDMLLFAIVDYDLFFEFVDKVKNICFCYLRILGLYLNCESILGTDKIIDPVIEIARPEIVFPIENRDVISMNLVPDSTDFFFSCFFHAPKLQQIFRRDAVRFVRLQMALYFKDLKLIEK